MDQVYIPIHPQILRIDSLLSFDVYVRTGTDKYERLFKKGKTYTALIHSKIFKYSVPALFILEEAKGEYFSYLSDNLDIIFMDTFISPKSKARIVHEYTTYLAMLLLENPDAQKCKKYKKTVELITDLVFSSEEGIRFLIPLCSSSFQEYNHLINVGIYGLGLLKEIIGSREGHNVKEIAAGFFLHDIGLHSVPKHIKFKNGKLNDEEWKIIKKHPEKGLETLETYGVLSEEMRIILLQHHERHNGMGYPNGLRGDQIHSYSKICSIADTFDALTSHRPYRYAQSSFKALKIMQQEMRRDFDPRLFAKFVLLFSKQQAHDKKHSD